MSIFSRSDKMGRKKDEKLPQDQSRDGTNTHIVGTVVPGMDGVYQDDQGRLFNANGHRIDDQGRLVNEDGSLLNDGDRVRDGLVVGDDNYPRVGAADLDAKADPPKTPEEEKADAEARRPVAGDKHGDANRRPDDEAYAQQLAAARAQQADGDTRELARDSDPRLARNRGDVGTREHDDAARQAARDRVTPMTNTVVGGSNIEAYSLQADAMGSISNPAMTDEERKARRDKWVKDLQEAPVPDLNQNSFRGRGWGPGKGYSVYLNGELVNDVDEASTTDGDPGYVLRLVGDRVARAEGVVRIIQWTGRDVNKVSTEGETEEERKASAERREKQRLAREGLERDRQARDRGYANEADARETNQERAKRIETERKEAENRSRDKTTKGPGGQSNADTGPGR